MVNKVDVLMHPVRMKISQTLMRYKENGLTPREMLEIIKDVPQATLYRHIQVLLDARIIRVLKEKKVRAVSEKYYTINEKELHLSSDEWNQASSEEKVNYISYYQVVLLDQYQKYLAKLEENNAEDYSTFSLIELKLDEESFNNFQNELNELMEKYYKSTKNTNENGPVQTIGITIIPET